MTPHPSALGSPSNASELDFQILKEMKIERAGERAGGRMNGRTGGRTDGRTGGRTDGRGGSPGQYLMVLQMMEYKHYLSCMLSKHSRTTNDLSCMLFHITRTKNGKRTERVREWPITEKMTRAYATDGVSLGKPAKTALSLPKAV